MKRCPNCGSFLNFKFIYNNGQPVVSYYCSNCSYNTENQTISYSNKTCVKDFEKNEDRK